MPVFLRYEWSLRKGSRECDHCTYSSLIISSHTEHSCRRYHRCSQFDLIRYLSVFCSTRHSSIYWRNEIETASVSSISTFCVADTACSSCTGMSGLDNIVRILPILVIVRADIYCQHLPAVFWDPVLRILPLMAVLSGPPVFPPRKYNCSIMPQLQPLAPGTTLQYV